MEMPQVCSDPMNGRSERNTSITRPLAGFPKLANFAILPIVLLRGTRYRSG
jgi:hypothetical protein